MKTKKSPFKSIKNMTKARIRQLKVRRPMKANKKMTFFLMKRKAIRVKRTSRRKSRTRMKKKR